MSGHSKWANIKHKKGKADAARGKITTKIGREITIAVRMGGPDPIGNMRLKLALSKARANNIPKDNIKRAIAKGAGEAGGASYEEISYEGYGPAGVAIMVTCLTDNKNRTASDVRHAFSKHGGNMGETGCVGWMFKRKGVFAIDAEAGYKEDDIMMVALDAGAEDIKSSEDGFEVITQPEDFDAVEKALAEHNIATVAAEINMVPDTMVSLQGEDAEKVQRTIDELEDLDDVQDVFSNADLPDLPDEED
ncbi:MAG: YebC/PmpR family DNA-binding transcriptional regulator [Acidaminococcaceae bacterium]|jgi:YebC/PmpR family DNA-binding regulatory protein|nr:YebC/PmpR family DNA-binding transcriptional regulator [Acidaminococcaceae bacterium]